MPEGDIEIIMQDVNQWSMEDLRELASQLNTFADSIESDKKGG